MSDAVLPDGPKAHGILGNMPAFRRDPLGFLRDCGRQYGDIVPLRFGSRHVYLLKNPDHIEEVLVTHYRNFGKGQALRRSTPLFGNGLLTSEGDFWRRQRKLAQPAFHRERIQAYAHVMAAETKARIAQWRDGETLDIHAEMTKLTLPIAVKTLFGAELERPERISQSLELTQSHFEKWIHYLTMLPAWFPTPTIPAMKRAISELDSIVYKLIAERRASGEDTGDLLSMLLRAQDEDDGTRMTDKQLRDEVLTLFLAGYETTALTLTWTLYLVAQHPDVAATLNTELQTVLAGRAPTAADRADLKYTEQVIFESMRLYPPAWTIGRTALQPCVIGGQSLIPGNTVLMSQWVVHRDPRWFADPDVFRPERWQNDFAKTLPKYAYFPFGGGPRVCIGNTFALMESVLLLATILQQWRFELVPDQEITLRPSVTLRPRNGIQMKLSRV